MFYFEQRKNRHHVIIKNNQFPLIDTFIQTETPSFKDLISETIFKQRTESIPQSFIGNVFQLTISDTLVILEDQISGEKNLIPTNLFTDIYHNWMNLTQ